MKVNALKPIFCLSFLLFSFAPLAQQLPSQIEQVRAQAQNSNGNASQQLNPFFMQGSNQTLPSIANDLNNNLGEFNDPTRSGLVFPGELSFKDVFPLQAPIENPPFAANLFIGGFESERSDGLHDNYILMPGDKISVRMWGAVDYADVVTLDNQGNIFIPSIGPLKLQGTLASNVNSIVTQAIQSIYTADVNIYVNLLSATPVSVFVAGPVIRPGQYAGLSADSVLYFLKRAGGIDFTRGSFRRIEIKRNNQTIQEIDLYAFATDGELPTISFQDGDTILVNPIADTVAVTDGARNSFTFEFVDTPLLGETVIDIARPPRNVTHARVSGVRNSNTYSSYVSRRDFSSMVLFEGDRIEFVEDIDANLFNVSILGNTQGASTYSVKNGTRLKDVLALVAVDPTLIDLNSIHVRRLSVALQQKDIIEQALQRLERSVFTAPISSTGEGAIRVQEAQLVNDFIARAREVEPQGKVVVSENGQIANILLEPGDEIIIPAVTDLIHLGGEILMPQSVVYNPKASVQDYIAWSGGVTERANTERIIIVKGNGMIQFYSGENNYWFGDDPQMQLDAGDQIIVLPRIDVKSLQTIKDITQIIYQIAVAANVALN